MTPADKTIVLELAFGDVRSKRINTPNDFVSHMIEHIAWRLGCAIDLQWPTDDWTDLGKTLGKRIGSFSPIRQAAAAQGMLDDGSAEALVELGQEGGFFIQAAETVDLPWFLSLRCEQLSTGKDLEDLLTGFAQGLSARISVTVCNHEDTHHSWEGAFRAIGVALNKIYALPPAPAVFSQDVENDVASGDIRVVSRSSRMAEIDRHTAETGLSVTVDFEKSHPSSFQYEGPPMTHYAATDALSSFRKLLEMFADSAGFSLQSVFSSKMLSSSHVLLEDMGMVVGRALREVLVKRMMDTGINGAGSSLEQPDDFSEQKITVGVSVEGRKFFRFMPIRTTREEIGKRLIIGQTIMKGLYSEDLDDFLDGLSWGLGCSIAIHIKDLSSAEEAWPMIFKNLGTALKEVFDINPYRKGVSPGVKANLS